ETKLDIANSSVAMPRKDLLKERFVKWSTRFLAGPLRTIECWSIAITLIFFLLGSYAVYPQDDIWLGKGTSNCLLRTNCNLGTPPTSGQNATVANGSTAQILAVPPAAAAAAFANILTITNLGSTVQLTAGSTLQVTTLSIGNGGTFHLLGALTVSTPVE